jgi:hypothetical protein
VQLKGEHSAVQGGCINVLRSAIGSHGVHPHQEEVAMCLEAVSGASEVSGRLWQMQRRKRKEGNLLHLHPFPHMGADQKQCTEISCPQRHDEENAGGVSKYWHAWDLACQIAGHDAAKMRQSDSTPGPLRMDEAARVITADEQRLTGHAGAVLCLALLDDRRLFSSSTDLTIKVKPSACGLAMFSWMRIQAQWSILPRLVYLPFCSYLM